MALSALVTEAVLVDVVGAVAVHASFTYILVGASDVALFARHRYMQSYERKVCEIVIKCDARAPIGWRVALRAIDTQLSGVYVACPVTGDTTGFEMLGGNYAGVTRVAINFLVPPFKWPLGVASVIERGREPLLVGVACLAFLTEAPGVGVHAFMATLTSVR